MCAGDDIRFVNGSEVENPTIEVCCRTCKSFVLAPRGMSSYCRLTQKDVYSYLLCPRWRASKDAVDAAFFNWKREQELKNEQRDA